MMPKRFWRDMPTTAFGDAAKDWIAVLPLAAIEQHGPHLPVGVDAIIAEGMVQACADALPDDVPVTFLPIQEIAKSNEHARFPGTLTLGWEVAIRQWVDIGASVARAGPGTLILITSHGGNNAPMDIAARELRDTQDMRAVTTSWGRLGRWQEIYGFEDPVIDIHAGLSETSVMLALRPDLVDMDKARDFASDQTRLAEKGGKLGWHGGAANMAWLSGDLNPQGAVGDAASASADLGRKDIAATVEGFLLLVRELQAEIAAKGARP
jgi:creatinine amidohydrolase